MAVEIVRHVERGLPMRLLADATNIEIVKIILGAIRDERDKQRELLERMPKLNTENVDEDIRTRLGVIKALNAVLEMPDNAKRLVQTAQE